MVQFITIISLIALPRYPALYPNSTNDRLEERCAVKYGRKENIIQMDQLFIASIRPRMTTFLKGKGVVGKWPCLPFLSLLLGIFQLLETLGTMREVSDVTMD